MNNVLLLNEALLLSKALLLRSEGPRWVERIILAPTTGQCPLTKSVEGPRHSVIEAPLLSRDPLLNKAPLLNNALLLNRDPLLNKAPLLIKTRY